MPNLSRKPCNYPNCPNLIDAGQTYCEKHSKKEKAKRDKNYNRFERDPKLRKFYSSRQWQKLRSVKISREPLCEHCKENGITKQAEVVDHIIPVKVAWNKRLRYSNLQSLCNKCHSIKTEKDKEKYGL